MRHTAAVCLAVLLGAAGAARAQTPGTAPQPPDKSENAQPSRQIGLRGYFLYDSNRFAASQTFDAVFGASRFSARGFGFEALRLYRSLFVRLAASWMEAQGLAIPLTAKMTPIEVGAGWRLGASTKILVPYGGGGLLHLSYRELSANLDTTSRANGVFAFGGADVSLGDWLIVGIEGQYRHVPGLFGEDAASVSGRLGETNAGGYSARVLIGVGH